MTRPLKVVCRFIVRLQLRTCRQRAVRPLFLQASGTREHKRGRRCSGGVEIVNFQERAAIVRLEWPMKSARRTDRIGIGRE
jgi:hypothetical protein